MSNGGYTDDYCRPACPQCIASRQNTLTATTEPATAATFATMTTVTLILAAGIAVASGAFVPMFVVLAPAAVAVNAWLFWPKRETQRRAQCAPVPVIGQVPVEETETMHHPAEETEEMHQPIETLEAARVRQIATGEALIAALDVVT
jgi:hypothetical protein